uniref:Acetoacetyl-CoA synthase n=1 Tax=uncultured Thiotrichaceae bacterium TaxID=298394 RepID=A0A6S6TS96_9GAMM|nr:MAG: Acetoacetyl-CoA synthase [uncultured Thiotrichaceae bacterium]
MNSTEFYDSSAPKRASNLSINSGLLTEARKYKINLSGLLEQALIQKLAEKKRDEWLKENQQALDDYNQRIEARGVFSDGMRTF